MRRTLLAMAAKSTRDEVAGPVAALAGSIACITLAGILSQNRSAVGQPIVALVLVLCIVMAAAWGGRFAAIATSIAAALSFNFFHTSPYLTLRIESVRDVVATCLLFVVGVVAGEMAVARERRAFEAVEATSLVTELLTTAEYVAAGKPVEEVWAVTRAALIRSLDLSACRYEPFGTEAAPMLRISAREPIPRQPWLVFIGRGYALPELGAEMAVMYGGEMLGRIVLIPAGRTGVPIATRRSALIAADLFGAAAGSAPPDRILE
jgi:K+-sensing histidine kinase KdpD